MKTEQSTEPIQHVPHGGGRPRSGSVDTAILRATLGLLAEVGLAGTTIHAVARRSRVARASIYLRYPGRDALLAAAIRAAAGRAPIEVTGDLEADLRRGAEQARAILSSQQFLAVLPVLVAGLLKPRTDPTAISYSMLAPNRPLLVDEYRRLAASAGMRTDVDAEVVVDGIIGGLLNRLLVTGKPPFPADAVQIVDIVLQGVRLRRS